MTPQIHSRGQTTPPKPLSGNSKSALIRRTHLENLLGEAEVVIVVAPGGYGKSTFANQWGQLRREADERVIFLNLTRSEGDPTLLLGNIARGLMPVSSKPVERGSQFDPLAGQEALFASILDALDSPCWLILNDFHLIEGSSGASYIERLIEIADPNLRLFLTSRREPTLNLVTCAARGKLCWITERELTFTQEEIVEAARRLLPHIEASALDSLTTASGGWPVLVAMALTALRHTPDIHDQLASGKLARHGLIRSFVRQLLRQTALSPADQIPLEVLVALEDVSPALLEHLAPGGTASETWHDLIASGLIALRLEPDAPFSLHPVVREIIQQELTNRSEQIANVRNKAAEWYWQHGATERAITCAVESGNFAKAQAWLIESVEDLLRRYGQLETYLHYLGLLPTEYQQHPILAYYKAWSLGLLRRYQEAEEAIENLPETNNTAIVRNLMRATFAALQDRAETAFEMLSSCTPLLSSPPLEKKGGTGNSAVVWTDMEIGIAAIVACYCHKARGEFTEANNARRTALSCFTLERSSYARTWTTILGVQLLLKEGRFRNALVEARAAITACPENFGFIPLRGMLGSIEAFVLYERNDLEQAKVALDESLRFLHKQGMVDAIITGYVAAARIEAANNAFADALDFLAEGERLGSDRGFRRLEDTLRAERIQLLIRDGQYHEGERLARHAGFLSLDTATPLQRDKGIRIAVRLARHGLNIISRQQLYTHLQHEIAQASASGRRYKEADFLLQHALIAAADGDESTANKALERALSLAATEGYIRLFIEEGQAAHNLLTGFMDRTISQSGHIVSHANLIMATLAPTASPLPKPIANSQMLVEQLSERELQILRLLSQGSSNQIIARRLYLTEGTVKWHLHNIYGKLGVSGRTAAVVFAQRIGLLSASV